jgi:hypothetical protein
MHGARQLGQILRLQEIPHALADGPLPRPGRLALAPGLRFRHGGHGAPGFSVQLQPLLLALHRCILLSGGARRQCPLPQGAHGQSRERAGARAGSGRARDVGGPGEGEGRPA